MRQAPFLKSGDLIDFVAPSFGVTTEPYATRFDVSKTNFLKWGYKVKEQECVRLAEGVASSASPEKRAKEINDSFLDDSSLVLSVGGGETMDEILPFIDFKSIKESKPKWFMGFSDNTNLTFPLATLADLVTIYGPCAPQFFMKKPRLSELDALRMLKGEKHFEGYKKYSITPRNEEHPLWTYRLTQPKIIKAYNYHGPIQGTLLGGCLDCLLNLCGTKYDEVNRFNHEHPEGVIWFLEACDLSPLGIRRGLFQLREANWFNNAKGFLFGRHFCGNSEILGVNKVNATLDILSGFNLPILMDIDLGHISPSLPIKCGAEATVRYENDNIVFDYKQ